MGIGYWVLGIGYWVLGIGYWVLGIGCITSSILSANSFFLPSCLALSPIYRWFLIISYRLSRLSKIRTYIPKICNLVYFISFCYFLAALTNLANSAFLAFSRSCKTFLISLVTLDSPILLSFKFHAFPFASIAFAKYSSV